MDRKGRRTDTMTTQALTLTNKRQVYSSYSSNQAFLQLNSTTKKTMGGKSIVNEGKNNNQPGLSLRWKSMSTTSPGDKLGFFSHTTKFLLVHGTSRHAPSSAANGGDMTPDCGLISTQSFVKLVGNPTSQFVKDIPSTSLQMKVEPLNLSPLSQTLFKIPNSLNNHSLRKSCSASDFTDNNLVVLTSSVGILRQVWAAMSLVSKLSKNRKHLDFSKVVQLSPHSTASTDYNQS